jgi:hypothetical protein
MKVDPSTLDPEGSSFVRKPSVTKLPPDFCGWNASGVDGKSEV